MIHIYKSPAIRAGEPFLLVLNILFVPEFFQHPEILGGFMPVPEPGVTRMGTDDFFIEGGTGEAHTFPAVIQLFPFIAAFPYGTMPLARTLLIGITRGTSQAGLMEGRT
jgi:hypothetical protein